MAKKVLDESAITNDLKGASLFFPKQEKMAQDAETKNNASSASTAASPPLAKGKPTSTPSAPPRSSEDALQATTKANERPSEFSGPLHSAAVPPSSEILKQDAAPILERSNIRTFERRKVRHSFDVLSVTFPPFNGRGVKRQLGLAQIQLD